VEFIFYFGDVFTPVNFGLLLIGTIGGLILGATPGLSPTMAVALLIPFTFQLQAAQGLILLGAAYTSTVAGGAVLSSAVGGVFGVLLLIFLTPVLAKWALAFGPSHLFWLAILGVTVIGSLDGNSVVKGLLSGCIGLWLATIGFDDIMGAQRFIFHPSLGGGINIIAALIGLFAIPQVITMFARGRRNDVADVITVQKHPIKDAIALMMRSKRAAAVLLGGLLIHGIFPGSDLFDNHPDVAWTFINSMLIGQVLMCIFGLYVAGLAARIAQVPQSLMAAIVLGLAVFGSYSVQSSMGDVYVMASLGVMMYFLERFGFSAAPLVLGLILGPIAESNFIQGSMIANATDGMATYFFGGGLNIFLIAIVIASIIYSAWMEMRTRRYTSKEEIMG